jgi:hypothetical protein
MPNEIGTMTDSNYPPGYMNNYNGDKMNNSAIATPHKSQQSRRSLRRLKKSYSECEYDDMDPDFVMTSPSKRPYVEPGQSMPKQPILKHNSYNVNEGMAETNLQYQQDQLKSQYLLQQQQKLKEFKKDPNYNVADNYSSESSNDNRMNNNKSSGTNSNTNSLRRKKGLSTSSLCICDADTEVN